VKGSRLKVKRWVKVQKGHWTSNDTRWEKYLAVKDIPEVDGDDVFDDQTEVWKTGMYGPTLPDPVGYYEKRGWKLYAV